MRPPVDPPKPVVASSRLIHHGRKFDYAELVVTHPGGRSHTRTLVRHPGAVVIVPRLDDGRLVLIRVYRAAIDAFAWECCAGTLDPGEDPHACAARELVEETGYRPAHLRPLPTFFTSPGLSDERMHPFFATGLAPVGQQLEEDEAITVHLLPPAQVLDMIDRGEIADGKSLAALALAHRRGLLD